MNVGVLDGMRVLDFGRYVAGPFCACLLGDLGADVIRVERPGGGEDRNLSPMAGTDGGALFLQVNRNKRSLSVDPTTPEGRDVCRRLVATADVVVANLPGRALRAMGLDYETLRAVRADIVLAAVSAFGDGPYADRVGFDGVGQAMSGAAYLTGAPGTPTKLYVPWVDFGTASLVAAGTLAALLERSRTGRGQEVQGSLLQTALTYTGYLLAEQEVDRVDRVPTGNRGQTYAPADIFATSDGWVIVQVVGNAAFGRWARAIGAEAMVADPRFGDDALRGRHNAEINDVMAAWCRDRTSAEVLAAMEAAKLPAGPVYSPEQALRDPHVEVMAPFERLAYPGASAPVPLARTPVTLSETPGAIRRRPPAPGEHTDELLGELGYAPADIARLRGDGVV